MRWGPRRAGSSAMSRPGSSCRRATPPRSRPPHPACTATRSCAPGSARTGARRSPAASRTPSGRRAWAGPCRPSTPRRTAASVAISVLRLLLATVLMLLVAVPAIAHAGTREDIVADCYDDGRLDGNYSPSEIRDARNNLPADIDQYSDCRDVLARALGGSGDKQVGGGGGAGGGALGGTGGGGGGGAPAQPLTASGPEEQRQLDQAAPADRRRAPSRTSI